MKKSIMKIGAFMAIMSLFLYSNSFKTYASPGTEMMTTEAFERKMNELYSKNDSSFEILDDNGVKFISKEYADELYQKAEQYFVERQENMDQAVVMQRTNDASVNRVMPYDFSETYSFQVRGPSYPLAFAYFSFNIYGTINAQYDTFMNFSWSGVYKDGASLNYANFSTANENIDYQSNNQIVRLTFDILVDFEWVDPITGMSVGESTRDAKSYSFSASDF